MSLILPLLMVATLVTQESQPRRPVLDELEVVKLAGGMGFTEGPVWLPAELMLVFSNIPGSKLMQWSESAGLSVFRESKSPNGNQLDLDGRLLTCRHGARDIVRTEKDGSLTVVVDRFEGKRFNSPNDVAVGSDGTLWFTDPPWGLKQLSEGKELDGNWVYRLSPDGTLTAVIRDLAMPNGIALSPDGERLYVADTGGNPHLPDATIRNAPATLSAYRILSNGELASEPVWRVETMCDGMCVDEHGNVYATGNAVSVWSPDGVRFGTIKIPEQPSNVCFGGSDYKTLFITARSSVYSVKLDVKGNRPKVAKKQVR